MHEFKGKWISDGELSRMPVRNMYHRQLDGGKLPPDTVQDRHVLFRRRFKLEKKPKSAKLYISADDYYKLYINGRFVAQGPAPGYPERYPYNEIDVTEWLTGGEDLIAVHTYYQGLVNRVWHSGDGRHGLLFDLVCDDETVLFSDTSVLTHRHGAYEAIGKFGYETQFCERYDSRAAEIGFESPEFDDSEWESAELSLTADHKLTEQNTKMLVFEDIGPELTEKRDGFTLFDFGKNYVGYLKIRAKGRRGERLTVRYGQELLENGRVRYEMRCNCRYEDEWVLSGGEDTLDIFDYKSFRYAELIGECEMISASLEARHYPFELKRGLRPEYDDGELRRIWELCLHTQKYGVQEVIQDCMDREKGFYLGDGCYTALAHLILTGDDAICRKMIDDAFFTQRITPTLMTCLSCSFMQEIGEFPLMLVSLVLWRYRLAGDKDYLKDNYEKCKALLEAYRAEFEHDGLLSELNKWCVVEWPKNFQDGYAVDIKEGRVCHEPHVAINAYYIEAVKTLNIIAEILGEKPYRDEKQLVSAFVDAFYDHEAHVFLDGTENRHVSYIGNAFPFAFGLAPDREFTEKFIETVKERGISSLSLFGTFPVLCGLVRAERAELIRGLLLEDGAYPRMLREGATTTFEGWGKDTKWNTSLFHLTMSYAAVFMADIDLEKLFEA